MLSRIVGKSWSRSWAQPFIIENRPGMAAIVAGRAVDARGRRRAHAPQGQQQILLPTRRSYKKINFDPEPTSRRSADRLAGNILGSIPLPVRTMASDHAHAKANCPGQE